MSEITLKTLPLQPETQTIIISELPLEHGLAIMESAIASSSDPSGAIYYPSNLRNNFIFNDLTHPGSITAIRVEGTQTSTKQRTQSLIDNLVLKDKKITILDGTQSEIFWEDSRSLEVFSKNDRNILRAVVPPSETLNLVNRLKTFH